MAWRLHEHVLRGEIDNRTRGRVAGRIWLAGVEEPLVLQLLGDCHPDLAGCLLRFENPKPVAMTTKPPALRQRGTVGDITAARKVRVFDIPFEEAYAMIKAGGTPPEHMANALYLEWHADLSGRVVIESTGYRLEVSEPAWRFTAEELAERERRAAEESSNTFAVEIRADGTEEEWDEFRCEELLRESDARGEKYRRLLEKYLDHPDRDRIIAHEMGWTWIEEALDEKAETASSQENDDELSEAEDFVAMGIELPAPEPSREGIDWVRDEKGDIVHPIEKRATDALYALLDDLRAAGNPEERHAGLGEFLGSYHDAERKARRRAWQSGARLGWLRIRAHDRLAQARARCAPSRAHRCRSARRRYAFSRCAHRPFSRRALRDSRGYARTHGATPRALAFVHFFQSADLLPEPQRADAEKQHRHPRHDGERLPVFEKVRAAQDDGAHEIDEIGGREEGADGVEDPGHRFARENETGEEDARQDEGHRHLQRLHLVLRFRPDEQSEAEERENVNEASRPSSRSRSRRSGTKKTKRMIAKSRKAMSIPMQR